MTRQVSRISGRQFDPRWLALVALYRAARREQRHNGDYINFSDATIREGLLVTRVDKQRP